MMGLEKLLLAMTGMTQDEMRQMGTQGFELVRNLDARISAIENAVTRLEAHFGTLPASLAIVDASAQEKDAA